MMKLPRVCLTHSFSNMRVDEYVGKVDTSDEEYELIQTDGGDKKCNLNSVQNVDMSFKI